jgi:SAM-dependent methyltransferase
MEKKHILQEFLDFVARKNALQAKYLDISLSKITHEEAEKLESLLHFYIMHGNNTVEQISDKYLNFITALVEEQRYFVEWGKYRFSSFAEVENYYNNSDAMDSYTVALGLSTYLWHVHRELMRLFCNSLVMSKINQNEERNGKYLEIGPGHGEYFVTAMQQTNFKQYTAVDISKTSVDLTLDYIKYSMNGDNKFYEVIHEDIFKFQTQDVFDMIVMGEVLEHVENPQSFLRRIYQLASNDAYVFITTAINAPQLDHIYLFNNLKEVITLIENEKFTILDFVAVNANNIPLEKAEKLKIATNVGFIIKKKL